MRDSEAQPLQSKPALSVSSPFSQLDIEWSSSAAENGSSILARCNLGLYGALYSSHALSTWGQVSIWLLQYFSAASMQ